MLALSGAYLAILTTAALALMVRTERALVVVEAFILATACVMLLGAVAIHHKPSDEGTLVAQAARTMMGGGEIYGIAWPQLFVDQHIPITKMMNGGADYTFGYPPLRCLLTAPALLVVGFPAAASYVTTLALLIGAIGLWLLLPIGWRSGATAVMLGFPFLPDYARLAYPADHRDGPPHPGRRPLADDRVWRPPQHDPTSSRASASGPPARPSSWPGS